MQVHNSWLYVHACLFLLLFRVTLGHVIDDFSHPTDNNLGHPRSGGHVDEIQHGLVMDHKTHFLFERLDPDLDMTGMSLKINYTATTAGERTLIYMQQNPLSILQPIVFQSNVFFEQAHQQFISIPLNMYFPPKNLLLGYAFKIAGPLYVHGLELETLEPIAKPSATVPHSILQDLNYAQSTFYGHILDPLISINLNTIGMKREGSGITPLYNGVKIADGGYLNEYVGTQLLDYTDRQHIHIVYSSGVLSMHIQLQFHYIDSIKYTQVVTLPVQVLSGYGQVVNVPVAKFTTPQEVPNDVSVCILGPITIHHIGLIEISKSKPRFPQLLSRKRPDPAHPIWVDDLSKWPREMSVADNLGIPILFPLHVGFIRIVNDPESIFPEGTFKVVYRDVTMFRMRRNNLNLLGGVNINNSVIKRDGIILREDCHIFEQIAKHGHFIELNGGFIEIEYSYLSTFKCILPLVFSTIRSDNDASSRHICVSNIFIPTKGKNKTLRYDFKAPTPAQAFGMSGYISTNDLVIHQIRLSFRTSNEFRNIVLQDYRNPLPQIFNIDEFNTPPQIYLGSVPLLIDYGQNLQYHAPTFTFSNLKPGVGIEIMDDGWLNQDMHYRQGKHLRIQYSAHDSGTRKVTVTYLIDLVQLQVKTHYLFVVCNVGNYLDIYIPLLDTPNSANPLLSIQISGPLLVHQLELMDTVPLSLSPPPGHSLPDALLIDDFSYWADVNTNILHYKRHVHGNDFGFGHVTLHDQNQHLIELFRNKSSALLNMAELAFRVTYSVDHVVNCHISLYFDESASPSKGIDVFFDPGKIQTRNIPVTDLEKNLPTSPRLYHGVKIGGPQGSELPLIIHRIEISNIVPFTKPIRHEYDNSAVVCGTVDYKLKRVFLRDWVNKLYRISFSENFDRLDVWASVDGFFHCDPLDFLGINLYFGNESCENGDGPLREFFTIMAMAINRGDHSLFTLSDDTSNQLEIDPRSGSNLDRNLRYYRVIGRIIGLAIINNSLMNIQFVPLIYKRLLTPGPTHYSLPDLPLLQETDIDPADITDMALLDSGLHKEMLSLLSNKDIESLHLHMCLNADLGSGIKSFNLVKDGCHHRVTTSNVNQYVQQYVKWHIERKVELQMRALCQGLWEMVPLEYLRVFSAQEFALLLAGQSEIDIDDWMLNTVYKGEYHHKHPVILNFWRCIQQFEPAKQSKLLLFVTGSPSVPYLGFKDLPNGKFTITSERFTRPDQMAQWLYDQPGTVTSNSMKMANYFPEARTCTNSLWLPVYPDFDTLFERIQRIIQPDVLSY